MRYKVCPLDQEGYSIKEFYVESEYEAECYAEAHMLSCGCESVIEVEED